MKYEHTNKEDKCKVCKIGFISGGDVITMMGKKTYKCCYCGASFEKK